MTLRVPVAKATSVGMRKLPKSRLCQEARSKTVTGRARVKRTMWSAPRPGIRGQDQFRRPDLDRGSRARPLPRPTNQPEQSYSERQLYEAALDRMAREIAAVNRISETEAVRLIEQNLAKSPRRGVKPPAAADAQAA